MLSNRKNSLKLLSWQELRRRYHQEMMYLPELTGYEIVDIYGGYHKESGNGSGKNVIRCVKKN